MEFGAFKIFTDQGDLRVAGLIGEFIGVHISNDTRAPTVTLLHTGTSINSLFGASIAVAHLAGHLTALAYQVDRLEKACPIAFYSLYDLPWGFCGPFQSAHAAVIEIIREAAQA